METSYKIKLNKLLASYQIHYQNLRSLHWNIKGQNFFELHLKYEELYTRTQIIIDDLAERLLVLQITPFSTFSDYLKQSLISENLIISESEKGMKYVLEAQNQLLSQEREILKLAADSDDEGTMSLISDLIREKEKTNWMFNAWLNN
ncbi:MAG: DNA starvation/stationary phase protection protein [Flavobacteriia bacterium]|nr:DNA starvation/stationary phase protection protein [Flavobacteriia bacterium]